MNTRTYQKMLGLTIFLCIVLGVALGYVLLHTRHTASAIAPQSDPVVVRGPAASTSSNTAPLAAEPVPLAQVQLSPQRLQEIGVTTAKVTFNDVNDDLKVPGNVEIDEKKIAYVQIRFPGWIQNVYANATYQYVRKGEPLFTIYSPDLVSSEQEYLLARQNQMATASQTDGTGGMNMAAKEGGWLLQAAEERIRQFGVPAQAIADLERTGKIQRNIAIDSPASGFITERNALPNAYVQPDTKLYTIADLSTVWIYADVFQDAVGRLRPGNRAQVTVDAYPGRTFYGRIDQILPQVDATTRTVRVRLIFSNPGLALKPGMYVNVNIHIPLGRQIVIPASAVLASGRQSIAFVDHGHGYLEPRTIQTGLRLDDSIVVLGGLKPGEQVVSSANFLVDSEAQLQAALSGFAPPPPPTAPSTSAPAEQVKISLTTQPDPPHKGTNQVRVQLVGNDGNPLTGAQVSATFFMPAMPAMGMAAERTAANLVEKGGGLYQGTVSLPSGGTYQVTITVQRAGQTVATKQLSLAAAGGM